MPQGAIVHETFNSLRAQVNHQLDLYLGRLGGDCPARLRESMAYSLLGGGKRLRPLLVLLACDAAGGAIASALPAACAIEMVHTYSLIHDDLPAMDDDVLRRGRPTCHVKFGEAQAILAGDALLTWAFEVMGRDVQPPSVAAACCVDLANAAGAIGMVAGQVADLEAEKSGVAGVAELEAIHRRKTGRLLCAALTIGGRIGRADAETIASLENYGTCVGLAFQIVDDLLDITGEQDKMGKGVRKDAHHGKSTYAGLLGLDRSRELAHSLIDQACRAIAAFGERGQRLEALAQFILERDH
jgi:geranylgeranyl diphosphate synthase, type II